MIHRLDSGNPMRKVVLMSGLPASGKSHLGRAIAQAVALPHIDKDDDLEALFALFDSAQGLPTLQARTLLSRLADQHFLQRAAASSAAVLSAWWRHPKSMGASGTDASGFTASTMVVVELHCQCSPETAMKRFLARQRHPGHADRDRRPHDLLDQFQRAALLGPLFPELALTCTTESPVNGLRLQALLSAIGQRLVLADR